MAESVFVDLPAANVSDCDVLVLPGRQINPDLLRVKDDFHAFIRDSHATGRPLAEICHAPWLLIEAGAISGKAVSSYKPLATDLKTDVKTAGGKWENSAVVMDIARSPLAIPKTWMHSVPRS